VKQGNPSPSTPSRYVVGFDLGTTNSAVTYVDAAESPWRVRTFAVPQVVAPGQVEARETLPSFHYQAAPGELPAGALKGASILTFNLKFSLFQEKTRI
jgi:molecular chaperone DnaK (HSP70)